MKRAEPPSRGSDNQKLSQELAPRKLAGYTLVIPPGVPNKESAFSRAFYLVYCEVRMFDAKGRGENCRWQFARQPSDENYVFNREVEGLPKVGRIPPGVPMKETVFLAVFFIGVIAKRSEISEGVRRS